MPAVPKPPKRVKVRKRMKRYNATRRGHKFPNHVDEGYRAWIRGLGCILSVPLQKGWSDGTGIRWHDCAGPIQVCHVKSRGAGGPDRQNCVPMCASAHADQHVIGIRSFEKRWGVSLKTIARQLTAVYEAECFLCP